MLILIVVGLCLTLSLGLIVYDTNLVTVNKAIINTPREYFYLSIPLLLEEEEPYFDKNKLQVYLKDYYDTTIKSRVIEYNFTINYINPADYSYCLENKCQGVQIEVEAFFPFNQKINRKLYFSIWSNKNG